MFSLFKRRPKNLLSSEEQSIVVNAIQQAEKLTSGEVRVFIESRCGYVNAMDRASEIFFQLKMQNTQLRNGVLIYVAVVDHQMAIFADDGIYNKVGDYTYWHKEVEIMRKHFKANKIAEGLEAAILDIGKALQKYFPYNGDTDKNELPDDIVFGH